MAILGVQSLFRSWLHRCVNIDPDNGLVLRHCLDQWRRMYLLVELSWWWWSWLVTDFIRTRKTFLSILILQFVLFMHVFHLLYFVSNDNNKDVQSCIVNIRKKVGKTAISTGALMFVFLWLLVLKSSIFANTKMALHNKNWVALI